MSSLSLLLRQLLYFSVLFFSCQEAWVIFHTLLKKIKYQNFSHCLQTGFLLVWNCGTIIILLYSLFPWLYKYYFCLGILLGAYAELFSQLDFQSHWPFLSFCFPEYDSLPPLPPSHFFQYGLQSTFIGFMLLGVHGKAYFDWMGTAYESHWSFWMIYLSTFNNVANLFYLILSAIILYLFLGHCWKHWLVLRTVWITGLSWSSPLKRLFYNGNTPVPATFWGGF